MSFKYLEPDNCNYLCLTIGSAPFDTPEQSENVLDPSKAKVKRTCLASNSSYDEKNTCQNSFSEIDFQREQGTAFENKAAPAVQSITQTHDKAAVPVVVHWIKQFQELSVSDKSLALSELVKNCDLNELRNLHDTIQPYFQRDFISLLPADVSLYILSFLPPQDLLTASLTCKSWRALTEDHHLWKNICQRMNVFVPEREEISISKSSSNSSCLWKRCYLRHCAVELNWRRGSPIRELFLRGHDEHVITCLQVWNGRIVSGSDDDTLKVWCTATGKVMCNPTVASDTTVVVRFQCLLTLTGHSGGVWSSQVSEDGSRIVSGSTDRTVKVWDSETGECIHTLYGHTSTVRCLALKGNILVSGSRDSNLRVWNIDTGECIRVFYGHLAAVRCVQFDGKRVVSGAYDYTIKVWDISTPSDLPVHTLLGHTNRVYSLQFDSERDLVISGSLDTSIKVWEIVNGRCIYTLVGHQSLTSGMQLRGNILVSGNADSTIKVWNISSGFCLHTLSGPNRHHSAVTSLQFLPNGLVVSSSDDGCVKLWDAINGEFIRDLIRLPSGGAGGCIWRLRATSTSLICAVGSRNGTEDTKLLLLDFSLRSKQEDY
ncbi:F-box/WD repeat-containing protein 7 [Trichinella patagoniensis]|uniref:F-box/WD repeat-containing protein 7 n=1 Tax=Trichinella patagoniensis TaxID=990121 RepID=A0A0V1A811_9BILA|nr:F-box/WD repeat-containing protein 7 [Trichinella patagoniensis]